METVEEQMKGDPLFEILEKKLHGSWTPEKASEIQRLLQEFNRFHSIYTRTRKRDVQSVENRAVRTPHKVEVEFTADELELYNTEIQRQEDNDANILAIISRKRMMTSCWPVYVEKHPVKIVPEKDSKLEALRSIIRGVVDEQNKKIIIFSFFTQTLEYLDHELRVQVIQQQLFTDSVPTAKRKLNDSPMTLSVRFSYPQKWAARVWIYSFVILWSITTFLGTQWWWSNV